VRRIIWQKLRAPVILLWSVPATSRFQRRRKKSLRVQALAGHIKAVMRRFFSEAQPIDEVVDELFSLSSDLTLLKELIGRELIESLDLARTTNLG